MRNVLALNGDIFWDLRWPRKLKPTDRWSYINLDGDTGQRPTVHLRFKKNIPRYAETVHLYDLGYGEIIDIDKELEEVLVNFKGDIRSYSFEDLQSRWCDQYQTYWMED